MSGSTSSRVADKDSAPDAAEHRRELADELLGILGSEREARWILEAVAPKDTAPAAWLAARERAVALASRRAAGEPLQHVLGRWAFRELEVTVDARALIPRPETEIVVEIALEEARRLATLTAGSLHIADLGTGSGVIACSIARELDGQGRIYATDISEEALALAEENILAMSPETRVKIELCPGSWFDALPARLRGRLDLLVSNPPYLGAGEWPTLDPVVRDHDPYDALVAGPIGTEALDHLIDNAAGWLSTIGVIVLEIAPHQSHHVLERASAAGFSATEVRLDLAGRERVLVARR